ncbi:hypothetical protein CCR94_21500 [Rhodoblastus sphagnicola]|uniref:Uncharacterized protein n=1 Tax=Rhodoblastus sphagnicola TaxID=333368 RepID=A0A2S6MX99_9HYPH|nr:hypothetical protein [Rhodoblastus sphagnicola]MBB4201221.1 putative GH25 family protein [Rhodoblastus sphagnicola]PPQ26994.1 hypothetical protein CCR94_21500 [Rhodoblastus sphagnicola]
MPRRIEFEIAMLRSSADVLSEGGEVKLDLVFTHPMERSPVMKKARPKRVGAVIEGKTAWTLA